MAKRLTMHERLFTEVEDGMWVGKVGLEVGRTTSSPPRGAIRIPRVLWDGVQSRHWEENLERWVWVSLDARTARQARKEAEHLVAVLNEFLEEGER